VVRRDSFLPPKCGVAKWIAVEKNSASQRQSTSKGDVVVVADGICIRLYMTKQTHNRPEFYGSEIFRTIWPVQVYLAEWRN